MARKFNNPYIKAGDVFVMLYADKYYLYCTRENDEEYDWRNGYPTANGDRDGLEVHVSDDMEHWTNLGYCLEKGNGVIGEKWFWAPEVSYYNGKFYMVYATDEHIAIAVADKPEGPFRQEKIEYLVNERSIDGHLLFDDDGRIYLYYVKLENENAIYVAEMKADLSGIEKEYDECLIRADKPWELIDCKVAEGPFVLKHKGLYYLTYSCNHVRNVDYAVGCAVSKTPFGPFEKYENNPILIGKGKLKGYGHHSFVYAKENELICVHHCHNPYGENFKPRRACFHLAEFVASDNGDDVLVIYGDEE